MGQGHKVFNHTKREFLNPHTFNDGYKLCEFGAGGSTMEGLSILLAVSNGRGGGDFYSSHPLAKAIIGRWGGDSISIIGDYAEDDDLPTDLGNASEIFDDASKQANGWVDISEHVCAVLTIPVEEYFTGQSTYDAVLDKFVPKT